MEQRCGVNIPSYDLSGKVAVVTGGGTGIGRAACIQLAACGAAVVVAGIPQGACSDTAGEIAAFGGLATAVGCDVSDEDQVEHLMDAAVSRFGGLDILIANAGVGGEVLPLLEQSADEFSRVVDVNLKGVFLCGKAAARRMIAQGRGGRIVNTCSIAYIEGGGFHGPYGAAKGGVSTLTRTMAREWAEHGITVNAVAPGLTRTPINDGLAADPEVLRTFLDKIPLGRMARPDEIASLMVYLCTESAAFITGSTLIADGGATTGG